MAHVKIHNPATGGVWECPESAVKWHLDAGWKKGDLPGQSKKEKPSASDTTTKEK